MSTNNPIRILLLADCLASLEGGAERQIYELARRLDKNNYSITIASLDCIGTPPRKEIESIGCRLEIFKVKRIYGLSGFCQGIRFFNFLRSEKIDILQTYHFSSDIWGTFWGHLAGVKVIISNRRDMGFWRKRHHVLAYRLINGWVSKIMVVAEAVKKIVMETEGVPEEKIEVIYNGVELIEEINFNANDRGLSRRPKGVGIPTETSGHADDRRWNPQQSVLDSRPSALKEHINSQHDYRAEFGISPTDIVILHTANLRSVKGHAYLIEAFAEIVKAHRNVKLILIGADELSGALQRQVENLGIKDKVLFTGSRKDAREILMIADICVLPSLSEGMSNAILEYMAAGKPVVATKVGGNPELVEDDVTGILVEKENVDQLTSAMLTLIHDATVRKQMGKSGLERVFQKFSMDKMVSHYQAVFNRCLKGDRS